MKVTVTFKNVEAELEEDVQINSQQKIKDTLRILQEAGEISGLILDTCKIKSNRRGLFLNKEKNYDEEHIYNGDILEVYKGGTKWNVQK